MTTPAELAKAFIEAADPHKDAFVSDLNDLSSVTLDGDFNLQAGIAAMLDQLASTMSAEEVRERAAEICDQPFPWEDITTFTGTAIAARCAEIKLTRDVRKGLASRLRAMPLTK